MNTINPNAQVIQNPPFSAEDAAEIIGTALVFHSTNRLVSIFLDDSVLPGILESKLIKKPALNIASKTLFKSMVMKKAMAGDLLRYIDSKTVKRWLNWAQAVPAYAKALAAEGVLLKEIEQEVVPTRSAQLF